jgi:hypothetical protein
MRRRGRDPREINKAMSDTAVSISKAVGARVGTADLQMLARVEKWMAMIREINRELKDQTKLAN